MLPRKNSLPLKTELKRIKAKGKLVPGCFFGLLLAQTDEHQPPRFAFIVSKKVAAKAVKRNQLRRLLTESLRPFLSQVKPGIEAVFLVKRSLLGQSLSSVQTEIKKVFQGTGCFKNEKNHS